MPVSYLFIDGASFRHALADISTFYYEGQELQVNWARLRGSHKKVFYYDAIPVQSPDEDGNTYTARVAPKRAELAAIERQSGYHVKTGDVQRRRTRGNEQKMVDVQLTVDMLQAASRGLFSHCALFTGDLDFRPLITALVEMGVDVSLYYPLGHTGDELLAAADNAFPLTLRSISNYLVLSDAQREVVPDAYSDLQTCEPPPEHAFAKWEDERHGKCFIADDNGHLRLVAERCPLNPKTHRLVLRAKKKEHLRLFAENDYGFNVPEW